MGVNIPSEKRERLENTVCQLTLSNSFEFPKTSRLTDRFLVERDYLFAVEDYGPLEVYDLKSGEKISRFMFSPNHSKSDVLNNIASDGSHIYLHIKGGEFYPKDEDILLAKITSPFENQYEDGTKYEDGFCESIGKRVDELKDEHWISTFNKAKKSGIVGRVDSFSLGKFLMEKPSLIWNPDFFTDRNPRFLIHSDMNSLIFLRSGNNYATFFYNTHFGEGGCGDSFRLKEGKLYNGDKTELQKVLEDVEEHPFRIDTHIRSPIGISVGVSIADYSQLNTYNEPEEEFFPFEIVFKSGKPSNDLGRILKIQHKDEKLHILRDNINIKRIKGSWNVIKPARLDSYDVSTKILN